MAEAIDPSTVEWINREAAKLEERGFIPGSPREDDLLRHWQIHRPKMLSELMAAGLAEKFAMVLLEKQYQSMREYLQAGMPPTDAREEADREWLLMEPEAED